MDVLSDVLQAVRLSGAFYFEVKARHPWISLNPSMDDIGRVMLPEAAHVIPFHIMLSGEAWARTSDGSVDIDELHAGDVVMFPFGHSHIITSDIECWTGPDPDIMVYKATAASDETFTQVQLGGDGEPARFVCGYLGCDTAPFNPLLGALPKMLIVRDQVGQDNLMQSVLSAALDEKKHPAMGARSILARLSELMFVNALRSHMETLGEDTANWLSGLRDDYIGKALHLIHSQPAKPWTVDRLAQEVCLSRSAFSDRFTRHTGESVMQYVGRWRMQLASKLLTAQRASVGQVAEQVGYQSEAAFQRAFKRHVGITPGRWRRRPA